MLNKFRLIGLCSLFLSGAAFSTHGASSIIVNGDFEAGNVDFTSAYTYVTPGPGHLTPPAVYTVDNNPHDSHGSFYSMGDHTTGSGNMMIINGSTTTGISVWEGSVAFDLTVGAIYDFSAWAASVHPVSPAVLTFSVDGVDLGTFSPTTDGSWSRLFAPFTAGQARPVFKLLNANPAFGGNDFAIDDIDIFRTGTTTHPIPDGGAGWAGIVGILGMLAAHRRLGKK